MKIYNTGKIKIGSNYHPETRPEITGDMLKLQIALLDSCFRPTTFLGRVMFKIWSWL